MSDNNITTQVYNLLKTAFTVDYLDVIDETYKHRKHPQFIPGKYHIKIIIIAPALIDIPPLQAHRQIYDVLDPLMQTSLHAVSIQLKK